MTTKVFVCMEGHDCAEVDDTGDTASAIAISATKKRFEPGGCDKYVPSKKDGMVRCGASVNETSV